MENNVFYVYDTNGTYLGMVRCRLGNDVFIVDDKFKNLLDYISNQTTGRILHLDNQSNSHQNWEVRVGTNYKNRPNEFWFKIISNRETQHPRPVPAKNTSKWYHYIPGWDQLTALFKNMSN